MPINTKPTILYLITQGEFGGAQHYILDLAKAFLNEYKVMVAFGEVEKSQKFIDLLEASGIDYYKIPELKRHISFKDDYKAIIATRKIIAKTKPTILHLNSTKMSVLGSIASIGLKCQVVYTAHGWVFNEKLDDNVKRYYIWAEKLSAFFKKKIICVSEFDRQTAINYSIAKNDKLTVVHNGIPDFEILSREQARRELSEKFKRLDIFENFDFVVGSIGYLYKNKGFDFLINSIKLLRKENHNPLLLIIGDGREKNELENWITQLDLSKNVFILGEIEKASRYLRSFDIYACASIKEGLSYTVIEAMTAGLPIVATNVGGNPELISDHKEGILVEASNPNALSEAILNIYNNPSLATEIANGAHEKALKNFEIEDMVYKTGLVYQTLLSQK